jgi:UDP-glucose 6-dehydrogenase
MILSSRKLNENYIIDILGKLINGVKSVSILGLSFKGTPPTNDIRDSYALTLIDFLKSKSIEVSSYDPLVFDEDFKSIKLKRDNTLEDAFLNKDLIIIQNNNEIFKRMNINKLSNLLNKDAIILDLWSLHTNIEINNSKYIGI